MNEENANSKRPFSESSPFVWVLAAVCGLFMVLGFIKSGFWQGGGAQPAMPVVFAHVAWRWGVPIVLVTISFQLRAIIKKLDNLKS